MDITEETYNDLSARIDAGEFLGKYHTNAKDETPELPPLPAAAPEDLKTYRDKCQHILDFYEQKIKTKEAQIENMRLAIEGSKAQSQAYDETVKLNSMLEKTIEEQKDENNKMAVEIMNLEADKDELECANARLKEECSKLQKENEALDCQNDEIRRSLNTLEEECDQLRKQVRENMWLVETATSDNIKNILEKCIVQYVCDIKRVPSIENVHIVTGLLKHMIKSATILTPNAVDELTSKMDCIDDERYKRQKEKEEKEAQRYMGNQIFIGQHNNGDGLMTNDKPLIPDDIRKMANKTAGL